MHRTCHRVSYLSDNDSVRKFAIVLVIIAKSNETSIAQVRICVCCQTRVIGIFYFYGGFNDNLGDNIRLNYLMLNKKQKVLIKNSGL